MKNFENHLNLNSQRSTLSVSNKANRNGRRRAKASSIRVEFNNQTICHPTAIKTLIASLKAVSEQVGFEKIVELKLKRRGYEGNSCNLIVTQIPKGQLEKDYVELEFAKGYWLRRKSSTDEKLVQLGDLNNLLKLNMKLEKI